MVGQEPVVFVSVFPLLFSISWGYYSMFCNKVDWAIEQNSIVNLSVIMLCIKQLTLQTVVAFVHVCDYCFCIAVSVLCGIWVKNSIYLPSFHSYICNGHPISHFSQTVRITFFIFGIYVPQVMCFNFEWLYSNLAFDYDLCLTGLMLPWGFTFLYKKSNVYLLLWS